MCLTTVDKEIEQFEYGWKVFAKGYGGKLYSQYGFRKKSYPVNKWMIDNSPKKFSQFRGYTLGFHFYKTRSAARRAKRVYNNEVVRKVLVKNIVASGLQNGCIVGVARQMKILE